MDIALESLIDTLKALPLLLPAFILLEWLEHRRRTGAPGWLDRMQSSGPLAGALLGAVPQCGISAVAAAAYARRTVTAGTLLAVFISTSDEAVPVLMAHPHLYAAMLALVGAKALLAVAAGFGHDAVTRARRAVTPDEEKEACEEGHHHHACGHEGPCLTPGWPMLLCALNRTAQVALFLWVSSFAIGYAMESAGQEAVDRFLLHGSVFQPALAGLVGLIPHCASSVAITDQFIRGHLTFGSALAGLGTAAGMGGLILFRDNRPLRDSLRIALLLYLISVAAGTLTHLVTV